LQSTRAVQPVFSIPLLKILDFQAELGNANILIPIVFITGRGDIPMSLRAMKAGAVEFLTKPLREQDLLDAVRVALNRDRTRLCATRVPLRGTACS